jgi:16S rRNA (uracil1498-N3)-methyltransferase
MRPGAEAFVFDGWGREYACRFKSVRNNEAQLEITGALTNRVESSLSITLAHALAKGDRFDFIVQKATELGVAGIVPLLTEHTQAKPKGQAARRIERWRRISLEALKQCGRRTLVEIEQPVAVEEFLNRSGVQGPVLIFTRQGGKSLTDLLRSRTHERVTAVVGPEGGWSDRELKLFAKHGCQPVTLGPRVLRTETAAIVAVALIQHEAGDLSRDLI